MSEPKSVDELEKQEREMQAQKKRVARLTEELECPAELPAIAKTEWHRIVGELAVIGCLSKFDRLPLAIYCSAYALWIEAITAVQAYGSLVKTPSGYLQNSPYLYIQYRQEDTMIKIAAEYGFTPAARTRKLPYRMSKAMLINSGDDSDDELQPLA